MSERPQNPNQDNSHVPPFILQKLDDFESLVEMIPDATIIADLDGKILLANRSAAELYASSSAKDLIGTHTLQLLTPDDRMKAEKAREYTLREGVGPHDRYRYEFMREDGSRAFVEANASLLRDPEGNPACFFIVFRDMTGAHENTEALRRSEGLYRRLVQTIPDAMIVIDTEGNITNANEAAARLVGFSSMQEMIGMSAFEMIAAESRQAIMASLERSPEEDQSDRGEYFLLRQDGTRILVEGSSSVVRNEEGVPVSFIVIARDATERRREQMTLKQSEEKYRRLVEESLQGIAIIQDDVYVYANSTFAETLGYTVEELLSISADDVWQLVDEDDRENLRERNKQLEGDAPLPRMRFRYIRRDGHIRWVESFVRRSEYSGRPAIKIVELDITEQILAEAALKDSEERYRTIIQSMRDLIFVYDKNDVYAQYYAPDKNLLLSPPEGLIGKHVSEVLPDKAARQHVESARRVREFGDSETFDYELEIEGHTHWFSAILSLHEDGESIVAIVRDINSRVETEQMLQESEEQFSRFADHMPGAVFIKDEESTMLYINEFMKERFAAADWLGRSTMDLFPEDIARAMVESDRQALEQGVVDEIQFVPDKNGVEHVYQILKFTIEREDRPTLLGGISLDITNRVRTEEALKQSEERYRTLFESAPVAIVMTDFEGNIIAVNRAMLEATGYTWEEIRFLNAKNLYASEQDRERVVSILRQEGKLRNYEITQRRKDGSIFYTLLNEDVLELGGRTLILAMIRDITDLKQTQDALRESEERYRILYDSSPIAIGVSDRNGKVLEANNQLLELFGYTKIEMQGLHIQERYADPRDGIAVDMALKEDGYIRDLEVQFEKKDGTRFYGQLNVDRLVLGEQALNFFSLRDITEKREAEIALRESSRFLQTIYDAIPDAVLSADTEFNIVSCNQAVTRMLGYTPEELIGQHFRFMLPEGFDASQEMKDAQADLYAHGFLDQREYLLKRKSGEVFPASFSVALLRDDRGNLNGFVGALRDVTDKHAAEREIVSARDRAMLYLDVITHDIGNQMQVILAGTQLVTESEDEEDTDRIISMVVEATERCNTIISRVMTTRSLGVSPMRSVILSKEISTIVDGFADDNPEVEMIVDISQSDAQVRVDSFLDVMMMGLLDNAVTHNPHENKKVWVTVTQDETGLEVAIGDNGDGLSDKQKNWILDMGRRYGGLGLHISKQIAEKYSGRILVADRVPGDPSQGAEFRVWFPRADK